MSSFFEPLTRALSTRAAAAATSLLGPASETLRTHLLDRLSAPAGATGSYLAPPVFESLFEWERDLRTMDELAAEGLLPAELVAAMDAPPAALAADRFGRDWRPYRHQAEAWRVLCGDPPRSVLVTTGTASGKTECFLVPILADLVREAATQRGPLEGVRALFLYPLNALINSQRDRLAAWTHAFDDRIRFALYNGATPDEVRSDVQRATPYEVKSRETLRASPPPILVTNATMLEYMLVRREDEGIVRRSRGHLRWIVVDEAHTYLGSSAAEVSLLLRRVIHAFGARPADVRFVATSATIASGDDVLPRLQEYLANLAGVPQENVIVVTGQRTRPEVAARYATRSQDLPAEEALTACAPEDVYAQLASASTFRAVRAELQRGPLLLPDIARTLGLGGGNSSALALSVLDQATRARPPADDDVPLLPLRAHLFMRTQQGLYACCSARCGGRPAGSPSDWAFGAIHLERRLVCEHCSSRVFPIVFCHGCGEAYLAAREIEGRLEPSEWSHEDLDGDEVQQDDDDLPTADTTARGGRLCLLAGPGGRDRDLQPSSFDPLSGEIGASGPSSLPFHEPPRDDGIRCGRCGDRESAAHELFRPARAGVPFFLGVAVPTILRHLSPRSEGPPVPAQGRKLITFTDSRSGTARFALKAQLEAERNYVRSFVYHRVWSLAAAEPPPEVAQLRDALAVPGLPAVVRGPLEARLQQLTQAAANPMESWRDVRQLLAAERTVREWMRSSLEARYPGADVSEADMAEILMLRELMRRPKRQNSVETLGLVQVRYPELEARATSVPATWADRGKSLAEWQDFLTVLVDFFVRSHGAVLGGMDSGLLRWLGVRYGQPVIVGPEEPGYRNRAYPWPYIIGGRRPPRMARLLALGLELDLEERSGREAVNELLRESWSIIHRHVLDQGDEGFRLNLATKASLAPVIDGYMCPVTRRVLARTVLGRSPFQTERWATSDRCAPVTMPRPRYPYGTSEGVPAPDRVVEWLRTDAALGAARRLGAWTDFSDEIAGSPSSLYLQAAEHSAQQSKPRLQQLEDAFKEGMVNVLSCSTTMEMGVNLGGLTAVGMNNAPPGPANYLQRAGRAARRQESRAVVFTMCQGSAHGEAVFKHPRWPFTARLNPPTVSLRSQRIVRRHVHSLLLAYFLRQAGFRDTHVLRCGRFFEDAAATGGAPADHFLVWLANGATEDVQLQIGIADLVARTPLEGSAGTLLEGAAAELTAIRDGWRSQRQALRDELELLGPGGDRGTAVARAIGLQLRRLDDEYVLRHLASEGFLPTYGFPLHVVPFVTTTAEQLARERSGGGEREDSFGRANGYPSRHVSMAIHEYAPGSAVVIDGVVYESSGVTLAWQRPPGDGEQREIQSLRRAWRCPSCGAAGCAPKGARRDHCERCGREGVVPRDFLRPSGFAVDIRARPHNDLSKVLYVPRTPAWLSAGGGSWLPLSAAGVGRYRYDPEGLVLHHSDGVHGHGYAICLQCGFAVPEVAKRGEAVELPPRFEGHRRLRGGRDDGQRSSVCPVGTSGFSVQRHLALGADTRTDIVEVQLAVPGGQGAYLTDASVATSVAVALREALARHLNVDNREIGMQVRRTADPGDGRLSILLFDTADGGAGYVGQLADAFPSVLAASREILTCPRGCDRACHGCILAYDTSDFAERLDRQAALTYLSADLIRLAQLDEPDQVFGPGTLFEANNLTTALLLNLQSAGASAVRICVDGEAADAALDATWPLWHQIMRWRSAQIAVEVVAARALLAGLNWQEANALASFLEVTGVVLRRVEEHTGLGPRYLAASVGRAGQFQHWAVSSPAMLVPGPDWGVPVDGAQAVRSGGPYGVAVGGELIAPAQLRQPVPGTFRVIDVRNALNGPVNGFGSRFWRLIEQHAPRLAARLSTGPALAAVEYSDRYLTQPLSVRLLAEALHAISSRPGGIDRATRITIRVTSDRSGDQRRHDLLWSNWERQADQEDVTRAVMAARVPGTVVLEIGDRRTVSHHRYLRLTWADGRQAEVRLDQGLAMMQVPRGQPARFETDGMVARQVAELLRINVPLEPVPPGTSPFYVSEPA